MLTQQHLTQEGISTSFKNYQLMRQESVHHSQILCGFSVKQLARFITRMQVWTKHVNQLGQIRLAILLQPMGS
jgi:hypothetical protein